MDIVYFILFSLGLVFAAYIPTFIFEAILLPIGFMLDHKFNIDRKSGITALIHTPLALIVAYFYALSMATNVLLMHHYFSNIWFKIFIAFLLIYALYWQQLKKFISINMQEKDKLFASRGMDTPDQSEYNSTKKIFVSNAFVWTCIILLFWPEHCPKLLNWVYQYFMI